MIRYVWIASLLAILCIVLYIPSAVPPEAFVDVLRAEHAATERVWGTDAAAQVLARMLNLQEASKPLSDPPKQVVNTEQGQPVDAAMVSQVTQVTSRLFGHPYFRSLDALFVLVMYRLSAIAQLLPVLLIFSAVVVVDGFTTRAVRAKELVPYSAEMFSIAMIGAILLTSIVVVALFVPLQMHPLFAAGCLLLALFSLSRAIANYHVMR